MPATGFMIKSDAGIELPPDICLHVAEHVIDSCPKQVLSLLLVSKSFNALLQNYEKSITKCLFRGDENLAFTNAAQSRVISSCMPPKSTTLEAFSYPWLFEMRCRSDIIGFLVHHKLTTMEDISSNSWPTLDTSKSDMVQRIILFKKNALSLLYRLADCATGCQETLDIRAQQSLFLEHLSVAELAALGVMVEVIGHGFFTLTKAALHSLELATSPILQTSTDLTTSRVNTPVRVPFDDLMNDNWVRECMCVFEDQVQKYGPYFAWAYLEGSKNRENRPDLWARSKLQEGHDNMYAFELGYTMSFASLQSVVWRIFCKKEGCDLLNSWSTAKMIVESGMAEYQMSE